MQNNGRMRRELIKGILIMGMGLLVSCGSPNKTYNKLPLDAIILAFGDSITYGYNAPREASYPAILSDLSGMEVINRGISGEKAFEGRIRLQNELETYRPELVLIELGGNDFLARRSENLVKEDLRAMIGEVKVHGAIPVLIAVPEFSMTAVVLGMPSDASLYRELAKEEEVLLISNAIGDVLKHESLRSDQIHPNSAGYYQLAESVYEALKKAGLL
ncbi:MAG: arylesterase [Xanthomonadaceae bacterium]|nr:arylesterase [Xanthomonadaceae bacterium]